MEYETEYVTVEYSAYQGQFHISDLEHILKLNCWNAINQQTNDYQLLAIFDTYEEANEFIRNFRQRMRPWSYKATGQDEDV